MTCDDSPLINKFRLEDRTLLLCDVSTRVHSGRDIGSKILIMARYFAPRNEDQINKIRTNSRSKKAFITRYILNTTTIIDDDRLKRMEFGDKDESKPHKTILLVGETGVGKSTLINAMVNYMLGVESKDRIWVEIVETKEKQTDSQTHAVTVYDVFIDHSWFSLTAIDTPGFGSTEGIEEDLSIAESLHELFKSKDGVHEIDAVCLVMSSSTTRLSDRQLYIFDAVLSLFGNDVEENIVVLITHASTKPTNAIKAIKQANVVCAKTDKGEPVYFRFNNCHCEDFDDGEIFHDYMVAWDQFNTFMQAFLAFTNERPSVSLKRTEIVLKRRKQLTASVNNIKERITVAELKQIELKKTEAFLQQLDTEKKINEKFIKECMVDEPYKEKVPIESNWWNFGSKEATCCSVCEENCHYPGCWWVRDLSRCSVMSEGKCTVCTGKCPYSDHVKEDKIYVVKTRRVKKTLEELKRKYENTSETVKSIISRLKSDKEEQERQKVKLVEECYQCVMTLGTIALKSDSVSIIQHMDFLIEKVKETGRPERVKRLEEIKKR
ncbi:septin-8-like isoform X3, partial [Clarias magur]